MDTSWIPIKQFFYLLLSIFFVNEEFVSAQIGGGALYRGKYIGRLETRQHDVSGEVYAVDAKTIHIRAFTYTGSGPDAFFWTGFTEHPSPQGILIPNDKSKEPLGAYNGEDITITLPGGLMLRDVKWLSVWCRSYEVNFGNVYIPGDLDYPQPHVIGSLSGEHGVSSGPIVVVDAQTILVPDFSYDGQAPDTHFWIGRGKPGPDGMRVPDETGGDAPLVKSDKKTMVLALPGDLTIFDIDFFGVWCRLYYVDFGHVKIASALNVPPSLRMLDITPQSKLNCEVLWEDLALEVRWAIAGDSIVMQLVGKVEDRQYMSFGLSGEDSSQMIGGDTILAWFDKTEGRGHVVDYYLDGKTQCSETQGGTCPDSSRLQADANNVRLLSATVVNGFTMLTFQRPLSAHDELDKAIFTNGSQAVIWAIGPVNQRGEALYHTLNNRDDFFIDFGRVPKWNCPTPDSELSGPNGPSLSISKQTTPGVVLQRSHQPRPIKEGIPVSVTMSRPHPELSAWKVPPILCHEPEDRVFFAQIGPNGGKRGNSAITGHTGSEISWLINGLLIPEIHVVRGKTYTFVVEGGNNPLIPAMFHPFYITNDAEGDYKHKTQEQKNQVKVFAGVGVDAFGNSIPLAAGRLCQWYEHQNNADSFASYGAYQRSLSLRCDDGQPGILQWTPDEKTPDLVYYQSYTHRFLGWKIKVMNSCKSSNPVLGPSESSPIPVQAKDQEVRETNVGDVRIAIVPQHINDMKSTLPQQLGPNGINMSVPIRNTSQLMSIGSSSRAEYESVASLRSEQIGFSSESEKFMDYHPPHLDGVNEGGLYARANFQHSRNLPKREELRSRESSQQFTTQEILGEDSSFETIKVEKNPFELPINSTGSIEMKQKLSSPLGIYSHIKLMAEDTPPNISYILDERNHEMKEETKIKQPMPRNGFASQPLRQGSSPAIYEKYQVSDPFKKRRHPTSNFHVHDMERVSESKDLIPEGNQAPIILSPSSGSHVRPIISRISRPPPGTVVDGRKAVLNKEGNFRPHVPLSFENQPRLVTYGGRLRGAIPEISVIYPHLNTQHSSFRKEQPVSGTRDLPFERFYASLPLHNQNGNHNLISSRPGPMLSKIKIIPTDDTTMEYIKDANAKELPGTIEPIRTKSPDSETQQRRLTESSVPDRLESSSEEEAMQIFHAYNNNPTRVQKYQIQTKQEVPQNNTDLHILTDIWSIINNQEDANPSKAQAPLPKFSFRATNPQRSGLPMKTRLFKQPHQLPHRHQTEGVSVAQVI